MSNLFKTNYDADVLQIPGINSVETIYDPSLKIFEVFINRKKINRFIGVQADEAKLQQERPFEHPELIKVNRGLRKVFGMNISDLQTSSRRRIYVEPRQMAMAWLAINTKLNNSTIGSIFKPKYGVDFNYSTVSYAKKTILGYLESDKGLKAKYEKFDKCCKSR